MIELARVFGDSMVLQRGKPIAVWGKADPSAPVTVRIQGQTAGTTADAAGHWKVTVGPLAASFAETMTVRAGDACRTLRDVQVGEVWLAGGQSNMEFHMLFDRAYDAERPQCTDDALRFFDYPEVSYVGQIDEADYGRHYGFWRKATPEDLARFSAPGYWFAKVLRRRYGVPVGVVGCNWGGTPACAWMSEAAVRAGGGQVYLDEYAAATRDLDPVAYDRAFRADPANFQTDQLADPVANMMKYGATVDEMAAKLRELGRDPTPILNAQPMIGPKYERRPCGLYESMLLPLVPYGIRGVLWYQGETDGDCHPEVYDTLFPALIADWRRLWGEALPFLFVQIAPLERWMHCVGAPYAVIRAAQQHTADTVPGTGMAVITDAGMRWDIHPKAKRPVGERLARLAAHLVYGEDVLCEAPTLRTVTPADGQLTLQFSNAGTGLHLGQVTPHGETLPAGQLSGVTVVQDGHPVPVSALRVTLRGDTVVLSGPTLAAVPTEVGVAQGGWYQVNLYNSAALPARPARVCGG